MAEGLGTAVLVLKTEGKKFILGLSKAKSQTQGLNKSFSNTGKMATGMLAGAAVAGVFALTKMITDTVKEAAELEEVFETSMNKIVSLVGISREQMNGWSDAIIEMAPALRKTPIELADAMFFITSAGLRNAAALDALKISAKASASELGNLNEIAHAVTSAMNAYGIENLSAEDATDVLLATVREGTIEADELAGVIGRVIPIASNMGVEFHEVGAAIAAMSKTGTDAAEGVTSLRNILTNLLDPAAGVVVAMDNIETSAEEVRRQIREEGLLTALQNLKDLADENNIGMAEFFPNVRGLAGVLDLLGENVEENVRIFESLKDVTGETQLAFEETANTTKQKLAVSMSELQGEMIGLGKLFQPMRIWWADVRVDMVRGFKEIVIEAIEFGGAYDALISNMQWGFHSVKGWLGDLLNDMQLGFSSFKSWLGETFESITGGIFNIVKKFDEIGNWFGDKFEGIGEGIKTTLDGVIGFFEKFADDVTSLISTMFDEIGNWFGDKFEGIGEGIKTTLDGVIGFFEEMFNKIVGNSIVPDMVNKIVQWFEYMSDEIGSKLDEALEKSDKTWKEIAETALSWAAKMTSNLVSVFGAFFDWRLSNEELTENELGKILERQAKTEKTFALISIAINTGVAMMKAMTWGGPIAAIAVGILGAAQFALVAATPIPTVSSISMPDIDIGTDGGGGGIAHERVAGATFEQQRPIIVTIDVHDNQVLGGDLREFAVMLREEFLALDELGV